jgi:hypothetical protein
LSVKEIIIAITIGPDYKALDDLEIPRVDLEIPRSDLKDPRDDYSTNLIRELYGLFVSVIDGRIYLLHQTAREFLIGQNEISQSMEVPDWIWKHSLSDKGSNLVLANICM